MSRIENGILAGFLAAGIGLATLVPTMAADATIRAGTVAQRSPGPNAPLLGRVVITPSPEQIAERRAGKRVAELRNRAHAGQRTSSTHAAGIGAL